MGRQTYNPDLMKWACGANRRLHGKKNYYERGGKESRRRLAEERKAEGVCVRCGKEPAITDALGWTCLSYMEEHGALSF